MSSVAQWIAALSAAVGAVGTILAVSVAYLGLRGELRRANDDRAEVRRERHDREAAQARLVLIRTDIDLPPGPNPAMITGTHRRGDLAVLLDNQSTEPVLDADVADVVLRVRTATGEYAEPVQTWELMPDWNPGCDPVPSNDGRRWQVIVYSGETAAERHTIQEGDQFVVTVRYTDASGLRWARTGTEQPQRLLAQVG